MHRRLFLISTLSTLATPLMAAPQRYQLIRKGSTIQFFFTLNGATQTGTVPVAKADILIDAANLASSTADVSADIRAAKTGLIFATQALKSAEVLNAAQFPLVRFVSTGVQLGSAGRISGGAVITGRLTLRGVTRPLRLNATLTRPAGTAANDLRRLSVRLTGTLSRAAFGATGFPDLVADRVALDITAQIQAVG